eukprot:08779.XXX_372317_372529_1 [CDS] Oithona nana genome sequencing.
MYPFANTARCKFIGIGYDGQRPHCFVSTLKVLTLSDISSLSSCPPINTTNFSPSGVSTPTHACLAIPPLT